MYREERAGSTNDVGYCWSKGFVLLSFMLDSHGGRARTRPGPVTENMRAARNGAIVSGQCQSKSGAWSYPRACRDGSASRNSRAYR